MTHELNRPLITVVSESVVGGVGRQLELIAEEIPKRGFDLHLILSCERDPGYTTTVESFRNAGIRVDVVPMVRRPSPVADLRALIRMRSLLKARRPSLVHTHSSKAGMLGRRAATSLGVPCVHTPHVFAFEWATGIRRTIYLGLERMAAAWCDAIVALSEEQRQSMIAQRICHPEMIQLIPNGVSCHHFRPPSIDERLAARDALKVGRERPVVGVAARLEPQKGMGDFLKAAVLIQKEVPDVAILIAGTGSIENECRRRVAELGLDRVIRFCGDLDDMPAFYHALDGFILASLWEGHPYAVLEAMASKLPVVCTRSFGCDGLITDGESGLLADVGDSAGLASAAIHVLTDADAVAPMAERARAVVEERFSLDRWADALAELYRNLSGFGSPHG